MTLKGINCVQVVSFLKYFILKNIKSIFFICFSIFLMLKFKKNKKYYFNIFLIKKKYFLKKYLILHDVIHVKT